MTRAPLVALTGVFSMASIHSPSITTSARNAGLPDPVITVPFLIITSAMNAPSHRDPQYAPDRWCCYILNRIRLMNIHKFFAAHSAL